MNELVLLKCPNCSAVLRSEDIDQAQGLLRCSYCRAVAILPKLPGAAQAEPVFRPRPAVPLPPGIAVEDQGTGVCITRRWFQPMVFFLIPFCIAWNAFLIFWYSVAFSANAPWIVAVFPVVHVAVGIGLIYFVLALSFNRTRLTVSLGKFSVAHGPLPWGGNMEVSESDVDQIYCKVTTLQGKNDPHINYELWALLRDGKTRRLIKNALSEEQILFLEQKLESAMKITDRAVPGELAR